MRGKRRPFLILLLAAFLSAFTLLGGCVRAEAQKPEGRGRKERSRRRKARQAQAFNTEDEVLAEASGDHAGDDADGQEAQAPPEREIVDGKIRSFFTGEWIDAELGTTRPLAVMLNNTSAALPMSGISNASVIYECPVEGRITRWMGIFEDWEALSRIGSVRSCRLYYLHFARNSTRSTPTSGRPATPGGFKQRNFDVLSGATAGIDSPATACTTDLPARKGHGAYLVRVPVRNTKGTSNARALTWRCRRIIPEIPLRGHGRDGGV